MLVSSALFHSPGRKCAGAAIEFPLGELSRVWQEEFASSGDPTKSLHLSSTPSGYPSGVHFQSNSPHPAVARIKVPEEGATSYGSGTLIDVRDQFGLVITNWHVVRDANGAVEVTFPGGFTSKARAIKVDPDWDLAALVIWRPPVEPVKIAAAPPKPGDQLTICGYGPGIYRAATGRCTQYYSPKVTLPQQMVELDVEARQGDSGGPIFNGEGRLAGVLFGAGQGTTLGSFGGRVDHFLATLAPDIGQASDNALVSSVSQPINEATMCCRDGICLPRKVGAVDGPAQVTAEPRKQPEGSTGNAWSSSRPHLAAVWPEELSQPLYESPGNSQMKVDTNGWHSVVRNGTWFEQMKTALAAVGLLTIVVQMLRVAR